MNATTHLPRGVLLATLLAFTVSATAANVDNPDPLPTLPAPVSKMTVVQWDAFSGTLKDALASDHEGLKIGAMRLALQYSDYVDINASVIDLMRIYRNHSDDQVRRLAVVVLGSLDNKMVVNYLRLHQPFEESRAVRRTIRAVIAGA